MPLYASVIGEGVSATAKDEKKRTTSDGDPREAAALVSGPPHPSAALPMRDPCGLATAADILARLPELGHPNIAVPHPLTSPSDKTQTRRTSRVFSEPAWILRALGACGFREMGSSAGKGPL
ncbi:hypothetical protein Taro_046575 [Colocasia esculenta]|uniref:Uncharacterized protein n=1 Tax=Colocasia esculenta TaxID=4460 RepID=A0A843X7H9_COLES|nr:hypothetical protein [Colocasia esculenta]